jgi:F-type H+-transporting ATPase subunit gamma
MATLRDIKTRIKGVQNTQQITKAMKMVAAAKLRKAQESVVNARPYARRISGMLSHLINEELSQNHPLLARRNVKKIAVVVVSADRGLCGAFNTNIIREATRYLNEIRAGEEVMINVFCIGRKSLDFFRRRDYNIAGSETGLFSHLSYEQALKISDYLVSSYVNGDFDKIIIIYNEFKSIIQQNIVIEQFLPITFIEESADKKKLANYIFEPDQESIFAYLLPKFLRAQIWRILLESHAAELGARMTAMDNATTNATELIRTLKLTYNKERQAAITKEILEIVSGANALAEG